MNLLFRQLTLSELQRDSAIDDLAIILALAINEPGVRFFIA
jgi:hypothetical protein